MSLPQLRNMVALRRGRRDRSCRRCRGSTSCRRRSTTSPTSWPARSSPRSASSTRSIPPWTGAEPMARPRRPTPAGPDKQPAKIAGMFDAIAGRYDLLNHVLSGGHRPRTGAWRAIRALGLHRAGTRARPVHGHRRRRASTARAEAARGRVLGLDFAHEMLRVGRDKLRPLAPSRADRRSCAATRCACPLADRHRRCRDDGVRHPQRARNRRRRVAEIAPRAEARRPARRSSSSRCRRDAGACDRSTAGTSATCCPRVGRLVSRHAEAYTYLPVSVGSFFSPAEFCRSADGRGVLGTYGRPSDPRHRLHVYGPEVTGRSQLQR